MERWQARTKGYLPPPQYWLRDPSKYDELIKTPVDASGLIRIDALITLVKASFKPDYQWRTDKTKKHHFYYRHAYPHVEDAEPWENPATFSNLPIHVGLMPIDFEDAIHTFTIPADVPSVPIRSARVKSWHIAESIFRNQAAQEARERLVLSRQRSLAAGLIQLRPDYEGEDRAANDYFEQRMNDELTGMEMYLEQNNTISGELRIIPDGVPLKAVQNIGRIVSARHLNLMPRVLMPTG